MGKSRKRKDLQSATTLSTNQREEKQTNLFSFKESFLNLCSSDKLSKFKQDKLEIDQAYNQLADKYNQDFKENMKSFFQAQENMIPNVNRLKSQNALNKEVTHILMNAAAITSMQTGQGKLPTRKEARQTIGKLSKAMCLLPAGNEKEQLKIYFYRAILYSRFAKKDFAAFRLNANQVLSTKFDVKIKQDAKIRSEDIRYIADKLHKSYLDTIKYSVRRYYKLAQQNENQAAKKLEQCQTKVVRKCGKAEQAMINEAFATYETMLNSAENSNTLRLLDKKAECWFHQYDKLKEALKKVDFKWKFSSAINSETQTKQQPFTQPLPKKKSAFCKLITLNDGLKARKEIPKGRVILSEPIILAKWFQPKKFCSVCHKMCVNNWAFPCSKCTLARFCSKVCAQISKDQKLHNVADNAVCINFCYCLGLYSSMVHSLAEWLGNPNLLLKIPSMGTNDTNLAFLEIKDVETQLQNSKDQPDNCKFEAVAMLISPYSSELKDIEYIASLFMETFHLMNVLPLSFAEPLKGKNLATNLSGLVYKLLYFLKHCPLANAKLGPPARVQRKKKGNHLLVGNQPQPVPNQLEQQPNEPKGGKKKNKPILYGHALGPLGFLFEYSCQPNIRRQLNLKAGTIEYSAMKKIKLGDKLAIGWTTGKIKNPNPHAWIKNHFLKDCEAFHNQTQAAQLSPQ